MKKHFLLFLTCIFPLYGLANVYEENFEKLDILWAEKNFSKIDYTDCKEQKCISQIEQIFEEMRNEKDKKLDLSFLFLFEYRYTKEKLFEKKWEDKLGRKVKTNYMSNANFSGLLPGKDGTEEYQVFEQKIPSLYLMFKVLEIARKYKKERKYFVKAVVQKVLGRVLWNTTAFFYSGDIKKRKRRIRSIIHDYFLEYTLNLTPGGVNLAFIRKQKKIRENFKKSLEQKLMEVKDEIEFNFRREIELREDLDAIISLEIYGKPWIEKSVKIRRELKKILLNSDQSFNLYGKLHGYPQSYFEKLGKWAISDPEMKYPILKFLFGYSLFQNHSHSFVFQSAYLRKAFPNLEKTTSFYKYLQKRLELSVLNSTEVENPHNIDFYEYKKRMKISDRRFENLKKQDFYPSMNFFDKKYVFNDENLKYAEASYIYLGDIRVEKTNVNKSLLRKLYSFISSKSSPYQVKEGEFFLYPEFREHLNFYGPLKFSRLILDNKDDLELQEICTKILGVISIDLESATNDNIHRSWKPIGEFLGIVHESLDEETLGPNYQSFYTSYMRIQKYAQNHYLENYQYYGNNPYDLEYVIKGLFLKKNSKLRTHFSHVHMDILDLKIEFLEKLSRVSLRNISLKKKDEIYGLLVVNILDELRVFPPIIEVEKGGKVFDKLGVRIGNILKVFGFLEKNGNIFSGRKYKQQYLQYSWGKKLVDFYDYTYEQNGKDAHLYREGSMSFREMAKEKIKSTLLESGGGLEILALFGGTLISEIFDNSEFVRLLPKDIEIEKLKKVFIKKSQVISSIKNLPLKEVLDSELQFIRDFFRPIVFEKINKDPWNGRLTEQIVNFVIELEQNCQIFLLE